MKKRERERKEGGNYLSKAVMIRPSMRVTTKKDIVHKLILSPLCSKTYLWGMGGDFEQCLILKKEQTTRCPCVVRMSRVAGGRASSFQNSSLIQDYLGWAPLCFVSLSDW
jgi:hypothetical protein